MTQGRSQTSAGRPAGIQGAMALDPAQLSQINAVRGLQGRLESQEQELQTLRAQVRRPPTESDLELGPIGPPGLGSSQWPQAPTAEAQRGLVDTRQLGKPDKFSGEPAAFEDWSFVLEAYMCCVNRGFQALFERIRYSDVPVLQAGLSPAEAELSTQLVAPGQGPGHSPEHRPGQRPGGLQEAGERVQTPAGQPLCGDAHPAYEPQVYGQPRGRDPLL